MVQKVWDRPEIWRVIVELPKNPLRELNCYVIRDGDRSLIIDTGFHTPVCHEDLWAGLEELNPDLSKAALFLTHLHADHTGLVWDFVEKGVPVYMSRRDYELSLTAESRRGLIELQGDRFLREGFPEEEMGKQRDGNHARAYAPAPGFPYCPMEDGDAVPCGSLTVQAILTPGHTPGHMVLYLPEEQLLFSGDHVLFDITPNIAVWGDDDPSLENYISSLEMTKKLKVRQTFPAHREVAGDLYSRVDALIDHHGWRLNEIFGAVKNNPGSTAFEIAGHITWSARGLGWEKFPTNQKWFATAETLAHLDYLTSRGQIVRKTEGNLRRYYAA